MDPTAPPDAQMERNMKQPFLSLLSFGKTKQIQKIISKEDIEIIVDIAMDRLKTESRRVYHHILLQRLLVQQEENQLINLCDVVRPRVVVRNELNVISCIPTLLESTEPLGLPYLAFWSDRCDYYLIQIGRPTIATPYHHLVDPTDPRRGVKICVGKLNADCELIVLGFFGSLDFYRRLVQVDTFLYASPELESGVVKDVQAQAPKTWRIGLERPPDEESIAFVLNLDSAPVVKDYNQTGIDLISTKEVRNSVVQDKVSVEAKLGPVIFYGFCNAPECLQLRELFPESQGRENPNLTLCRPQETRKLWSLCLVNNYCTNPPGSFLLLKPWLWIALLP